MALVLGSLHGGVAVACGAFGAHGLRSWLAELDDGAQRLAWWETAAHYQLTHALALIGVAWLVKRGGRSARIAVWGFSLGALIFSGSLYAMTLTGVRGLGAVTPLGGVGLLVGWGALLVTAWKYES